VNARPLCHRRTGCTERENPLRPQRSKPRPRPNHDGGRFVGRRVAAMLQLLKNLIRHCELSIRIDPAAFQGSAKGPLPVIAFVVIVLALLCHTH